jgi:hypothetical protein
LPNRAQKLKIHLIKSYNLAFYTKVEQMFFFIGVFIFNPLLGRGDFYNLRKTV